MANPLLSSRKPLAPQEEQIIACIEWFLLTHKVAPTLTELAFSLKLTRGTVYTYLQRLIKKGYVARQFGVERGLTLIN